MQCSKADCLAVRIASLEGKIAAATLILPHDDTRWLADSPLADFLQFSEKSDPFFVVPRAFVKIMVPWGALGGPEGCRKVISLFL